VFNFLDSSASNTKWSVKLYLEETPILPHLCSSDQCTSLSSPLSALQSNLLRVENKTGKHWIPSDQLTEHSLGIIPDCCPLLYPAAGVMYRTSNHTDPLPLYLAHFLRASMQFPLSGGISGISMTRPWNSCTPHIWGQALPEQYTLFKKLAAQWGNVTRSRGRKEQWKAIRTQGENPRGAQKDK